MIEGVKSEVDIDNLEHGNPNSIELWIKYISFFIAKNDYSKAKTVAEHALNAVTFENSEQLFEFWTTYLNLEVVFGSEESLKKIFERACAATNSLKMHKHLLKAFNNCDKNEVIFVCLSFQFQCVAFF